MDTRPTTHYPAPSTEHQAPSIEQLTFDHIVEFTQDRTLFTAAREQETGHLRLFLISESTGNVYTRNGRADSWAQVTGSLRESIIARLVAARNNHTPVYRVNAEGHCR